MKIICWYLFALLVVVPVMVTGQQIQYNFKQISIDQGLPGQNVRQVFQDYNGIMWISVEAIGLCRYDGVNFILHAHKQSDSTSISSNYVNSIVEDSDSNLWVATDDGLNRYDRSRNGFVNYFRDSTQSNGLSSSVINTLYVDRDSNLWVGTGNGLCRYNPETDDFTEYVIHTEEATLSVNAICQHTSGEYFIGTNRGVIQFNLQRNSLIHWDKTGRSKNEPVHQIIRSILEDAKGDLWIATHRGINRFDFRTKTFHVWHYLEDDEKYFENEGFNSQYTSDYRHIWFASYTSGIVIIDIETNSYERILKEVGREGTIKSNHIRHIFQDRSGLLWISTKFEGLFLYDRRKEMFNNIPEKYAVFREIKDYHILCFLPDKNNDLYWVGTKYNGLYEIDLSSNKLKNYKHKSNDKKSLLSNRVQSVYRDSKDNLFVGMGNGFDIFNEKTGTFTHISQLFCQAIIEDSKNNIWVGTSQGVFVFNSQTNTLNRYQDNRDDFFTNDALDVMYIHTDKFGQVWFSTRYNGLYRYNPVMNKLTQYSTHSAENKLNGDAIRAVTEDISGKLWVGTKSDGAIILDQQKDEVKYLTTEDGLPSNFILSIQQDNDFNIWFGTHNGLSYYNRASNHFTNYTTVHGLQGNIFEVGVNGIFDDGHLLFGGHNGFNIFHPNQINLRNLNKVDSMLVTSVKVMDKVVISDVHGAATIHLKHNQNYLTIEFILVDYFDPLKHHFKYRMRGISNTWFDLNNKNYVAFSSLKPGNYKFEVKGTNEFGVINDNPVVINILIKPPYYQTWWFRAAMFLFVSIAILVFFRARIIRARMLRKELEHKIQERTESLSKANTELVSQNRLIENQKQEIENNKAELEIKVVERTKDLEFAKEKAEESDRLKSSFLANMSHEIRTPLNAILGFSTLIVDHVSDNPEFDLYAQNITNNTEMLIKIIDDVLDISKIEAKQLEVKLKEVRLHELLYAVCESFKEQLTRGDKKDLEIFLKFPVESAEERIIVTDKLRLRQVLFNLIGNAIKFTEKGFVEVSYYEDKTNLVLYVKDTGVGIKTENLSHIFERFYKVEHTEEFYRGNGLGLSLSKSIIELMDGTMWVDSNFGYGSTFYIALPNTTKILMKQTEDTTEKDQQKVTASGDSILIVEDEESNYLYFKSLLKKSNLNVFWATNGYKALDILNSQAADSIKLIIMDIKMPYMDGYQTYTEVRSLGFEMPIVAVTAYAQNDDKEKIMNHGFNDYVAKPVNKQRFLKIIEDYC